MENLEIREKTIKKAFFEDGEELDEEQRDQEFMAGC